jgi:carboxymethylenebutenolidase
MSGSANIADVFDEHQYAEFGLRDAEKALETMTDEPSVRLMPTQLGGEGRQAVRRFYADVFIPNIPRAIEFVLVSRTVGTDRLVDEDLISFTHTMEIPWLLPGVAPTGKTIQIPGIVVAEFENGRLARERVYWDQASVLSQAGLLDENRLPATRDEAARTLRRRLPPPAR